MKNKLLVIAAILTVSDAAYAVQDGGTGIGGNRFGAIGIDADVSLYFDAVSSQYSMVFMEDENRMDFSNDVDVIGDFTAGTITSDGALSVPSFTRHIDLSFGAAVLGPTSPSPLCNSSMCGLGFDADAEQAGFTVDIPEAWDAASDLNVVVTWTNTAADAIANTEDVDLNFTYRSIARSGELTSNGTAVSVDVGYTSTGDADGTVYTATFLIDYDSANQPVTVDDLLIGIFTRDKAGETNSYSGQAIAALAELTYSSTNAVGSH